MVVRSKTHIGEHPLYEGPPVLTDSPSDIQRVPMTTRLYNNLAFRELWDLRELDGRERKHVLRYVVGGPVAFRELERLMTEHGYYLQGPMKKLLSGGWAKDVRAAMRAYTMAENADKIRARQSNG